jgi:putative membrane protein
MRHEDSDPTHRGWRLFLSGICMGAADLVPGISGGTIAFLLGFYQPLMASIKSISWPAFQLLLKGKWQLFTVKIQWRFLLTLLSGIVLAIAFLAHPFHYFLSHPHYRVYVYGIFFGLILASFIFCVGHVHKWSPLVVCAFCVGALAAFFLTFDARLNAVGYTGQFVSHNHPIFLNIWLIVCGAIAACALLLPGISGSYLLTILGVYPLVIEALAKFLSEITLFSFNMEAFGILSSLGVGVMLGSLIFSRGISWLLNCFPDATLALLSGFVIGAIRSVWPFWSYEYMLVPLKISKGPQLIPLDPFFPPLNSIETWVVIFSSMSAFGLVILLEKTSSIKKIS